MNKIIGLVAEKMKSVDEKGLVLELVGPYLEAASAGKIPVVLFCAGASGRILAPFLVRNGIRPVCFCDNDPDRVGSVVSGIPIVSFETLQRDHRESLIIIATAAYQNFVRRQLLEAGFSSDLLLTLDTTSPSVDDQLKREALLMLARNGEPGPYLEKLLKVADRLERAYDLLADEKSRGLFIERLALVGSGFDYESYRSFLEKFSEPVLMFGFDNPERLKTGGSAFYFDNDVITLRDGEVYVDGGAFTGDSADEFIRACERKGCDYGRIFCFEPDGGNFAKLVENTESYRDITRINRGLWSSPTTLRFISSAQTESYGARIQGDRGVADVEVITTTIDGEVAGEPVSLIKMDIEGAEVEALKGATRSIVRHKPKLVISVYHDPSDIYEIPLLLHQMQPGYTFRLRHLGNYFDDTMLFAD